MKVSPFVRSRLPAYLRNLVMRVRAGLDWLYRRWFVAVADPRFVGMPVSFRDGIGGPVVHSTIAYCVRDGNGRYLALWTAPTRDDDYAGLLGVDLLSGYFWDIRFTIRPDHTHDDG